MPLQRRRHRRALLLPPAGRALDVGEDEREQRAIRWLADGDADGHDRLARYCARNPLALERMRYDAETATVHYASDKSCGPTAGTHSFDALKFIALLVAQIPDRGQVMQRYYGYYSNRQRGKRRAAREAATDPHDSSDAGGGPPDLAPLTVSKREIRLRWADLLRRVYEVDPLQCPACGAEMRIMAFILQPSVIDRILARGRTPIARLVPIEETTPDGRIFGAARGRPGTPPLDAFTPLDDAELAGWE